MLLEVTPQLVVGLCFTFHTLDAIPAMSIVYRPENMEAVLRKELLSSNRYNPGVRPVTDVTKPIPISIDLTIHHIVDVNEKLQYLQSQLWFRIFWQDEFLSWNKSEYNDLHHIQVYEKEVWTPDIEIYNEMGLESRHDRHNFPITIEHNGHISWRFPRTLQTGCRINITNFPYDSQVCDLDIGSWSLDSRFANVTSQKAGGDISAYRSNGEWKVTSLPSRNIFHPYVCCEYGYYVVIYQINLERRTNYYIVHMIFPCILISFVNACAFLLPVSSGERMSMSVTTLLGLVVFLLIIADLMPPTSGVVPIIDVYFGMCITVVSLSVLLNVFIIHLHFRGSRGSRMPRWLRAVIYRLGIVLMYRKLMHDVGFTPRDVTESQGNSKVTGDSQTSRGRVGTYRKMSDDNDDVFNCPVHYPRVGYRRNSSTGHGQQSQHGHERFDSNRPRRHSEIFGDEEIYISVNQLKRFDPPAPQNKVTRSPSMAGLDPILEAELQPQVKRRARVTESCSTEWKITATILDRLFFILDFVIMIALTCHVLIPR